MRYSVVVPVVAIATTVVVRSQLIDGVRCLVAYLPEGVIEKRNRRERRDWLRHLWFAAGVRRLGERLAILWRALVLNFRTTLAPTTDSSRFGPGRAANIGTAALLLNLVACQTVGPSSLGSAEPTDRVYTSADLESIVVTQDTAPEGLPVEEGDSGRAALTLPLPPGGDTLDDAAFVDALTTRIGHSMTGGYTSWSALFETADAAERAFEFFAKRHESEDGWGLHSSRPDLELGDESVYYTGPSYGWNTAGIYFWRENNLLLAAVGTENYNPEALRSIAEGMDARAG